MSLLRLLAPPERCPRVRTRRIRICVGALAATVLGSSLVWAAGFPPFPNTDSATVSSGGSVSVLDSGATSVLANDVDFEGDTLTAILDEDVKEGTLTLRPDGTFLYVHGGTGMGMGMGSSDRFRYVAFDGLRFSRRTDVNINIIDDDPGPPRIVGQRAVTTNEDEARLITVQDLIIEGGSGDLVLWVGEGANYTVTGVTIVPAENFSGTLNAPVRVNDGSVDSNTFTLEVGVRPVNDPPFVVGPIPDQVAQEGEFFQLPLAQQFGDIDPGDTLIFTAIGLPPSRSLVVNPSTGLLSGTPQLADAMDFPYDVTITAEDDERATASLSFRLTIFPRNRADLELSLSVQPNPALFTNTPLWDIKVDNLGPGAVDQGILTATWFSSEAPITLSLSAAGCTLTGNSTTQPEIVCPFSGLPALASNSFLVQSSHEAPGDTHLTAWVTAEDSRPENNVAALSLNLAASFSDGPIQSLAAPAADVDSSDLNGDGHVDLAVAGEIVQIYFNTGERQLTTLGLTLGPGGVNSNVTLIDWNMDGAKDVAITHADNRNGQLYLNDGVGAFSLTAQLPVTNVSDMLSADLNGDGQYELVVSGVDGTAEIRNDGQGQPQVVSINATVARHLSSSDLDINGLADLILTEAQTRAVHLLQNNGDGSFSESVLQAGSVVAANAGDVDGDGVPDLLLAIDGANLEIPSNRVLRNQLNGTFSDLTQLGASATAELLAADVTGDSINDLVAINATGAHQVYVGDNLGGFTLDGQHILSLSTLRGHLVDINGDASLDLVLAGAAADTVGIYANDGLGHFGLGDSIPPVVSLIGESIMITSVGQPFVDPGATALDDIDGDITSAIVVDNPVDPALVGNYSVRYAVTDRAGNIGQVVRAVQVGAVTEGGGGGSAMSHFFVALLAGLLAWRRVGYRKG